jgi:hypothetical protein
MNAFPEDSFGLNTIDVIAAIACFANLVGAPLTIAFAVIACRGALTTSTGGIVRPGAGNLVPAHDVLHFSP